MANWFHETRLPAGRPGAHFGNVHRRQHRSQPHPDTADDPVDDEMGQKLVRIAVAESHFGIGRPDGRNDKKDGGRHQAPLTPQPGSHHPADQSADHTADQGARHGETEQRAGRRFVQAERYDEIEIEVFHRPRNHRRIVPEQQSAQGSHQRQKYQITVAFIHFLFRFILDERRERNGKFAALPPHGIRYTSKAVARIFPVSR